MKKIFFFLLFSFFFLVFYCQTPPHYSHNPANAGVNNSFFLSGICSRFQFIYQQSEIAGMTSPVNGPVAIDTIWFRHGGGSSIPSTVLSNLTIRMGHTTLVNPAANFAANYSTVPVSVLSSPSYTYTPVIGTWNVPANGWTAIPLQTLFNYNFTDNLLIDIEFSASSGAIAGNYADNGGIPVTQYSGIFGSPTASATTSRPMFGISPASNSSPPVPSFPLAGIACEGDLISLNGSSTNSPTSWQWSVTPAGPVIQNNSAQNTSISFPAAGSYTVTLSVSNSSGSNSVSQTINVSPEPTISVSPNPLSLCSGSSQNFTAMGAGSYLWSPSTGLSCSTCPNPIASPTANITYTVVGTMGACDDTVIVPVTVSNSINPSIVANPSSVCLGGTTTLVASGGNSYTWVPDPTLSCTACQSPIANPTVTTTYTVTVASGSCPTATAAITVVVNTATPASVSSTNTVICSGTSTTLNGSGGGSYSWLPSTALSCNNCQNPVASPTITTTYTLSTTVGTCPTATAAITISVTPATNAVATAASYTICNGQNTSLTASGGGTYTWSPAAGLSCTNCSNPVATPTTSTVYTVTVTSGLCPPVTATVGITVNNCVPPVASYSVSSSGICSGDCIQFTSTSSGNPTSFNWQFSGGSASPSSSTASTIEVCFFTPGTYTVQFNVSNSGGSSSVTQSVFVAPNPSANIFPPIDTVIYGTGTTLLANPGDSLYSWSPSATVSCASCSLVTVTPLTTTWYYCVQTNEYGCSAMDSALVIVDLQCGEIFVPSAFSPNNDNNNDVLRVRGNCLEKIEFLVFDRWGELVFQSTDPKTGWDGTFRDKPMDTAVFFYSLRAETADGKKHELKGSLTLIR